MTNRKKKVLFFLPSLLLGGAERVTLNIIKALDRERFIPSIVLLRREGDLLEEVPPDVPIFDLSVKRMRFAWFPLIALLKNIQPDLIYSVMDHSNLNAILASTIYSLITRNRIGIVCSSHTTLSKRKLPYYATILLKLLVPILYQRADRVIVISEHARQDYVTTFANIKDKFKMLYNPAFDDSLYKLSSAYIEHTWFEHHTKPIVVTGGRLVPVKGFQYLLEAFAKVNHDIDCNLVIVGDGPEKQKLETLAETLSITEKVLFVGHQKNPFKYFSQADIFTHTSLADGLPTVLIEAMACGIPVIATNCPSGPSEIVTHEVDGLLISPPGDSDVLANAISQLLSNPDLATHLAEKGRLRARNFHTDTIVPQYEQLFEDVIWNKNN